MDSNFSLFHTNTRVETLYYEVLIEFGLASLDLDFEMATTLVTRLSLPFAKKTTFVGPPISFSFARSFAYKPIEPIKLKKDPALAWGYINGQKHEFRAEDRIHPEWKLALSHSRLLFDKMKEVGYKPDFSVVLRTDCVTEEEKTMHLCAHCERLFLAYADLKLPPGQDIIAFKNLRFCNDCHEATKYYTLITKRKVTIRDRKRFHTVENGKCSCNDFY